MSNPVLIVSLKPEFQKAGLRFTKFVLRFFASEAANFEVENQVFKVAGERGLTTQIIESD